MLATSGRGFMVCGLAVDHSTTHFPVKISLGGVSFVGFLFIEVLSRRTSS
jgi:hypothetical protein